MSVLTLIKEFILKKNKEEELFANSAYGDDLNDDEDSINDELLVDFEFINWIAKLAFSNTNMNAYWKIEHLRTYLVSLLLREGFDNVKTPDSDEIILDTPKKTERFIF